MTAPIALHLATCHLNYAVGSLLNVHFDLDHGLPPIENLVRAQSQIVEAVAHISKLAADVAAKAGA